MLFLPFVAFCVSETQAFHYERPPCMTDEVLGEVLGVAGSSCAPKCRPNTYECTADFPDGTTATPQCMLKDVDGNAYCGLLCKGDDNCPSGSLCKQNKSPEIGICMYPVSFTDWAHQSKSKKLQIAWTRPGSPSSSSSSSISGSGQQAKIAKVYAALQSLKRKYMVEDGDPDMLLVKELLSDMSRGSGSSVTRNTGGDRKPSEGSTVGAWKHDIQYVEKNLAAGLPGLKTEFTDTMYNIEHLEEKNSASNIMRGVIGIGLVYLFVGAAMKANSGYAGVGLIPHYEFWKEYPGLVMDGIAYSKILVGQAMGQEVHHSISSFGSRSSGFREFGSEIDNMGSGTFSSGKIPASSAPQFSTEGQGGLL